MSTNCCVSVPPDSSFQAFATVLPPWQQRLTSSLHRSVAASDQTLGHLEEEILHQTRAVERSLLEEAAQKKADHGPPVCPVCAHKLTRRTHGHARTFTTRFGDITVRRTRGWCRRCRRYFFPADHALGLADSGGYSPGVQEAAALLVSKMPVAEAGAVLARLTGLPLPRATLDRLARRQGQRAEQKRAQLDAQMRRGAGAAQQGPAPPGPITSIIEIDAWNIRERDAWGRAEALRAQGRGPEHWHWVYGGTCFSLDQRAETAGGRAVILSRGYVMTRGGLDALRAQIHAEALRHHLGRAERVLLIGDGALWIWKLGADRFPQAAQRLDYYHASQQLWAVARALHPEDETAARAWVEPLLKKLKAGRGLRVIEDLRGVLARVRRSKRRAVAAGLNYLETHRGRLDYDVAQKRGEPLGSGAIESTCRQYQCRFKRPGQFWTQTGDEALMCLETFWRNDRWHELFPHSLHGDPCKN